jgi:hypothetical protein
MGATSLAVPPWYISICVLPAVHLAGSLIGFLGLCAFPPVHLGGLCFPPRTLALSLLYTWRSGQLLIGSSPVLSHRLEARRHSVARFPFHMPPVTGTANPESSRSLRAWAAVPCEHLSAAASSRTPRPTHAVIDPAIAVHHLDQRAAGIHA